MTRHKLARITAGLVLATAIAASASACAKNEDTQYNAPAPVSNSDFYWHRVESPGNYTGLISTCEGPNGAARQTGLYIARDGAFQAVPGDPSCTGASDVNPHVNNG